LGTYLLKRNEVEHAIPWIFHITIVYIHSPSQDKCKSKFGYFFCYLVMKKYHLDSMTIKKITIRKTNKKIVSIRWKLKNRSKTNKNILTKTVQNLGSIYHFHRLFFFDRCLLYISYVPWQAQIRPKMILTQNNALIWSLSSLSSSLIVTA